MGDSGIAAEAMTPDTGTEPHPSPEVPADDGMAEAVHIFHRLPGAPVRATPEERPPMASQQASVTVTGFVGKDPLRLGSEGSTPVCTFRIASTRSHYDASAKQWVEHPTTWMSVKAYRNLASNVLHSVHKGDPLVVTGILGTEEWMREGKRQNTLVLEASSIGHDLSLGTSQFTRVRAGGSQPQQQAGAGAQESPSPGDPYPAAEQSDGFAPAGDETFRI